MYNGLFSLLFSIQTVDFIIFVRTFLLMKTIPKMMKTREKKTSRLHEIWTQLKQMTTEKLATKEDTTMNNSHKEHINETK